MYIYIYISDVNIFLYKNYDNLFDCQINFVSLQVQNGN